MPAIDQHGTSPSHFPRWSSPLVMIGADSHKRTHTLVALDEVGRRLAETTVAATERA